MVRRIGRLKTLMVVAIVGFGIAFVIVPRIELVFGGARGIHDAAALPAHIGLCGRGWSKDALERKLSLAELRARDGVEPVVVDPGPFAPCPEGPCTNVAQETPCYTVIYVRVGEDAYLDYSLQGGP
jgi:hypothetical protein